MTTYRIYSAKTGLDFGTWEADTAEAALVLMHKEADPDADVDPGAWEVREVSGE